MYLVHGEQSYIHYVLAAGSVIKVGGQELKKCRRGVSCIQCVHPFPPCVRGSTLFSQLFSIPSSLLFISTSPPVSFILSSTSPFTSSSSCHCPHTHTHIHSPPLVSLPRQTRDRERSPRHIRSMAIIAASESQGRKITWLCSLPADFLFLKASYSSLSSWFLGFW